MKLGSSRDEAIPGREQPPLVMFEYLERTNLKQTLGILRESDTRFSK